MIGWVRKVLLHRAAPDDERTRQAEVIEEVKAESAVAKRKASRALRLDAYMAASQESLRRIGDDLADAKR